MTPTPITPVAATLPGLDALIRRELKVGDPNDPVQLAQALMARYQADRRAQAIDGEARGMPFLQTPIVRTLDTPAPTASDIDLEQARDRVRGDLQALLADSQTLTMRPELLGWQAAIHRALDEGVAQARLGLDPARRDVAFAMRRQLGEYARLARLTGLFSPALRPLYRTLATSLDDAATVILVLVGESMANLGLSGGRFLLQTSYADLQARRDAVLAALRRIDGLSLSGADAGATHWPRGLRAHRQMNLLLEARGQGELRSLLSEAEMARILDELVQLASGGSPMGLRTLGSTAWSPLNRLRRFVRTAGTLVQPASHELAGLLEALQLFIEGFEPAGGFRLLRIARPALLSQSGGGLPNEAQADRRLVALASLRGRLAEQVEAWLGCQCDTWRLTAQAALDLVLFQLDRAIDHYAAGSAELGLCEVRASATHLLTQALLDDTTRVGTTDHPFWPQGTTMPSWITALRTALTSGHALRQALRSMTELLRPVAGSTPHPWDATSVARYDAAFVNNQAIDGDGAPRPHFAQVLHDEIASGLDGDGQWEPVLRQMTTQGDAIDTILGDDGIAAWQRAGQQVIRAVSGVNPQAALPQGPVPPHFEVSLQRLAGL